MKNAISLASAVSRALIAVTAGEKWLDQIRLERGFKIIAGILFSFLFVTPVMLCCGYQLIIQENAIVSEKGGFRFATMLPWGRSTLQIEDIIDCSYESIAEVHDHLILTVTPSCYEKESKSRTWSERSNGELRFDFMYTSPSPKETSTRLKRLLRKGRD